jgi:hypothetical protein
VVQSLAAAAAGAVQALGWAAGFYVAHCWPLLAIAAIPALTRWALSLRSRQMLPASASEPAVGVIAVSRGVLMLAIAGLDLLPDSPWWESMWPDAWTAALNGRIGGMSGRPGEWAILCLGVALIVTVLAGTLRLLTTPRFLLRAMALAGLRPRHAARRAEVIGVTVAHLITIPLTTLLMYAAVARAALCLRI